MRVCVLSKKKKHLMDSHPPGPAYRCSPHEHRRFFSSSSTFPLKLRRNRLPPHPQPVKILKL